MANKVVQVTLRLLKKIWRWLSVPNNHGALSVLIAVAGLLLALIVFFSENTGKDSDDQSSQTKVEIILPNGSSFLTEKPFPDTRVIKGYSDREDWIGVVTGAYFTCGLHKSSDIECWGKDQDSLFRTIKASYSKIYTGGTSLCGLSKDGNATCWGRNKSGQNDPPKKHFIKLALGISHSCGITNESLVSCWGSNKHGQTNSPEGKFIDIAAGSHHTCAIKEDKKVECWGYESEGRLLAPSGQYKSVAAGFSTTCVIDTNEKVRCWGYGAHGQASPPQDVTFKTVDISAHISCGIQSVSQHIECWGDSRITKESGLGLQYKFIDLAVGTLHVCGITLDHGLACWGLNDEGQIDVP